jgi:antitoxin (DNA-binding transcriptional repressor) of toxin-antitoxin stability system
MKTISIAELRHDPTGALEEVAAGDTYTITRYRHPIARIVPLLRTAAPSGVEAMAALRALPQVPGWADELRALRAEVGAESPDPWSGSR